MFATKNVAFVRKLFPLRTQPHENDTLKQMRPSEIPSNYVG